MGYHNDDARARLVYVRLVNIAAQAPPPRRKPPAPRTCAPHPMRGLLVHRRLCASARECNGYTALLCFVSLCGAAVGDASGSALLQWLNACSFAFVRASCDRREAGWMPHPTSHIRISRRRTSALQPAL